jgi:lysozyme
MKMQFSAGAMALQIKLSNAATIAYQQSVGGLNLIKGNEGCRLEAYLDSAGIPTIGWGSTRYADGRRVKMGDKLKSVAEANVLFSLTMKYFASEVNRLVTVPLTQNQFDALCSLVYNIGAEAFAGSTLLKYLNQSKFIQAADQFLVWNKITRNGKKEISRGLVIRRVKERSVFLKP